ncbi:MAG: helix-turn-helix domain-containing protein, partial [Rubrivivax sp.]|nr:helix-turn-helix domain-containing protein [Rubrivivax sp.]
MNQGPPDGQQRGIQSVEVGGQLLRALVHAGRPLALKDLAREAGMAPGKAHPYLVSFGKLGLVEQDRGSGHYGLGPLALQLGLMSLQQADP